MKILREAAIELGALDVATYIQSGNLVCRLRSNGSMSFEKKLSASLKREVGFAPEMQFLDEAAFAAVISNNPFAKRHVDPSRMHVTFTKSVVDETGFRGVEGLLTNDEEVSHKGKAIYFKAPEGIARSKAAEKLFRLHPNATTRNWRTCLKLRDMAQAISN